MLKKENKKILFLQAFPLQGCGSGIYTRELATEINKEKNMKVAVVCPEIRENVSNLKIYPLESPFHVSFTSHPDWPVSHLYKNLSSKEIIDVYKSFLTGTVKAVEDFQPDLIHVQHVSLLLWVANVIKSIYGINFIVTTHGTGIVTAKEQKMYIPLSQDALSRARKIIAVSKDNKQRLVDTFGPDFIKKISVMPSGINIEKLTANSPIKIINKKYGLNGQKVVLFAGKLTNIKGTEYLVQAAKDIKGDIYVIGDGPEKKNLEDLARKLGATNIKFLGYMGDESRKELLEFYYRADVFVAPSVSEEALGLVILEAMACSTPIVATKRGGIPSLVKDGVNGFLIKSKNSKQLAEACNKILENDSLAQKMKENARKIVEEKFSWQRVAQRYKRIYQQSFTNPKNGNESVKPKPHSSPINKIESQKI
jgi:glycosyltransferase involved in cell wall biosynthesis